MKKRIAGLLAAGVVAGVVCGSALADPPSKPKAIPTLLDFANCGGNGFPL
jgi:hypothetical protein